MKKMWKNVLSIALVVAISAGAAVGTSTYLINRNQQVYSSIDSANTFHQPIRLAGYNIVAAENTDFTAAAESTVHGVVHIKATTNAKQYSEGGNQQYIDPFEYFFGFGNRGGFQRPQPQPRVGAGSGVIISTDGYIITNNHVIDGADELEVTLNDNRKFAAKLVGTDPATDIALIKVEAKDLPIIPFGDSEKLKVGEWVLAVGNPFNLTSTVTAGIVSAKGRGISVGADKSKIESFIQTDAAVNPGNSTPFNPLYIYGDSGLGKTHVAQAIGNEISMRHPELQVLYVAMSKFQSQFQAATIEKNIPNFIHFYQGVDVLILDDIQELSGKPGTQNAFFNIFNHLQMSGKQLVLISDKPPVELKDIEERLLTRFKWGLSAQIHIPDYQTKIKIINAKAARLGAEIPTDVINYLANNISANIREIEGAISSLVANTSFMGKKITISLAKEILKGYISLYQKEITIDHIIDTICEQMGVDKQRLLSAERTREVAIARQIAMYLAKQLTKVPLTAIGTALGGRNHATVLHSCKTITNLMETDQAFKLQVEELEKIV